MCVHVKVRYPLIHTRIKVGINENKGVFPEYSPAAWCKLIVSKFNSHLIIADLNGNSALD